AFLRGAARAERIRSLTEEAELVAAAPHERGWQVHVIRWGRLAAAGVMQTSDLRAGSPQRWVDALQAAAETVPAGFGPVPAASAEEPESVLRWLESDGTRLVRGTWQRAYHGAARHVSRFDDAVAGF